MRKVHGSDAVLAVEERAISGRRCSKEASARFLLMLIAFRGKSFELVSSRLKCVMRSCSFAWRKGKE